MCKYSAKDKNNKIRLLKKLTFKNSYSIIPAPLRDFASMFKLNVHKEIMAYKLYIQKNINKELIDPLLFQLQYYKENKDRLTIKNFHKDCLQLMKNIELSKYMIDNKVDIMKYAQFYCMNDCIVLMQGMRKFNEDLQEVIKLILHERTLDVHNHISISAICYAITKMYGCFTFLISLSGFIYVFIFDFIYGAAAQK